VLANPLASPGIIGVNAGAGLAVTVCCAAGMLSGWAISLSAFGGAAVAAAAVFLLAKRAGASRSTVILAGVAMNSILGAVSDALTVLIPETAMLSGDFRVGGFSAVVFQRLLPAGALILLAMAAVFTLYNELDVLALGEETARGLGLPVRPVRTLLLLLAAMLAGAAVSFGGLLGFVGLMVPHAVRKLAGSENRHLIPLSAVLGAAFVTLCDLTARMAFAPYELPVGILLSVLGGPAFLWLLWKRKGGRSHA
jgi:iron complex transport system permease protein